MKKEFIIYIGLLTSILSLFSFESVVEKTSLSDFSQINARKIHSISIDIPAHVYFSNGNQEKVLIEGPDALLDLLDFRDDKGHFALKARFSNSFYDHIKTFILSRKPVNVYVTSNNIECIKVANNQGIALNDALFNGDRGLLKIENTGLMQMIRASREIETCRENIVCSKSKREIIANCL